MASVETQQNELEVISDGNPFNTKVLVDGQPLGNVIAIRWDISPAESKMIVDLDWVGVHYTGQATTNVLPPTARDVLRYWWRGVRRRLRKR